MYHQCTAAVIGTGFIGPVHVEALKRIGVNVKGILGSTPEKSEQARERLLLNHAYRNLDEIKSDQEIDSVHVAVPNLLHYDFTKQLLSAGKHVMCEKPLAMNAAEGAELVQLAKDTGLVAGVTYNIRFYPLNLEVRDQISQGHLGKIFSVKGSYVQDWLLFDTDYNWRVLANQGGALRAVADIGTHWMDLVCSITGMRIEAVFADLFTIHKKRKRPVGEVKTFANVSREMEHEEVPITTEDCGSVLIRFVDGAVGQLWVSQTTAGRKNCLKYEIAGSQKAVAWNSESPNQLWCGYRSKPNELLLKDASLQGELASSYINYPAGHNEGFPDTFKQCFKAFYDAIIKGIPASEALYPTFEQGQMELQVCDAILESHQNQKWVYL